jgi:hypothetical protein
MTTHDERTQPPDVDRLARSMLLLHGAHDDEHPAGNGGHGGWSRKAPDFAADPQRAAAVRQATARDRERYLNAGLAHVDCKFCHVTVTVKKLGPGHTAVQWNSEASQRCATFAEVRESGGAVIDDGPIGAGVRTEAECAEHRVEYRSRS